MGNERHIPAAHRRQRRQLREGGILQGHRIGYARVSTVDQNPGRQLEGIDVARIFTDRASGKDTAARAGVVYEGLTAA